MLLWLSAEGTAVESLHSGSQQETTENHPLCVPGGWSLPLSLSLSVFFKEISLHASLLLSRSRKNVSGYPVSMFSCLP